MQEEKSKKELLAEKIKEAISRNKQRVEYLEKYKTIMNTSTEELIIEHLGTGSKLIMDILELNTELLIRLLLK